MDKIPPILIPDTNYLMKYPDFETELWKLPRLIIAFSETVISELRGLASDPDPKYADPARRALVKIDEYQRKNLINDVIHEFSAKTLASQEGEQQRVVYRFFPRCVEPLPPLNMTVKDHQIIALAYKLSHVHGVNFCAILSNDIDLCSTAESFLLLTISRRDSAIFHAEIASKYRWKNLIAENGGKAGLPPLQPKRGRSSKVYPSDELGRYVAKLYRQMKALNFRTSIFLPSTQARIRLALEILQRERNPEKEIILIFLKDAETQRYWAGEIRQKSGLQGDQALIFGQSSHTEQIHQARVVFYQHRQIIPYLSQHITRLVQSKRKILALVDGSDLLDSIQLAILLYGCDQFVSLSHTPWNETEAMGRKILNIVLHNRALPDVSFTDAELEGWGHPVDLYLTPVEFKPEERVEWDKINSEFLRLHRKIADDFQRQGGVENFWEEVFHRLLRAVDTDAADLVNLREKREQIAQQANSKAEQIVNMLCGQQKGSKRQILVDFNRLWTPVLLKVLEKQGLKAVELPADPEDQRKVWQDFSNKYDTMIITHLPSFDLPLEHFQHLVLISPLQPIDEMIAVIDWAISRAATPGAVCTHVLYVPDTPEELAVITLAQAGFSQMAAPSKP